MEKDRRTRYPRWVHRTLESFLDEMRGDAKAKGPARMRRSRHLREWLDFETLGENQRERVTNLHQVTFNAARQEVIIEYYLVDEHHPPAILSYAEFAKHLRTLL